jgi:ABC-type nitrate/sulfonate/bicarbonate transport system substrate-binding protein
MFRGRAWVALSVVFSLSAAERASCEPTAARPSTYVVVGHASLNPQHLAFWVAMAEGYFGDAGLSIENVGLNGGPTVIQGLTTNRVNFGLISLPTVVQGWALGKKLVVVAGLSDRALQVPMISTKYIEAHGLDQSAFARLPLDRRLAVLKGSKWPSTGAGLTENKLRKIAEVAKLDPDRDLEIISFDGSPAAASSLLRRGRDGAPLLQSADLSKIPQVGLALQSQVMVDRTWADAHPGVVRRFVQAIVRGSRFIVDTPPEKVASDLKREFPELSLEDLASLDESIKGAIPPDAKLSKSVLEMNIDFSLRKIDG